MGNLLDCRDGDRLFGFQKIPREGLQEMQGAPSAAQLCEQWGDFGQHFDDAVLADGLHQRHGQPQPGLAFKFLPRNFRKINEQVLKIREILGKFRPAIAGPMHEIGKLSGLIPGSRPLMKHQRDDQRQRLARVVRVIQAFAPDAHHRFEQLKRGPELRLRLVLKQHVKERRGVRDIAGEKQVGKFGPKLRVEKRFRFAPQRGPIRRADDFARKVILEEAARGGELAEAFLEEGVRWGGMLRAAGFVQTVCVKEIP